MSLHYAKIIMYIVTKPRNKMMRKTKNSLIDDKKWAEKMYIRAKSLKCL